MLLAIDVGGEAASDEGECSWLGWRRKCEEAEPVPKATADLLVLSAAGGVASRYEAKENVKKRTERAEGMRGGLDLRLKEKQRGMR